MTAMQTPEADDSGRSESLDSVLIEFSADGMDFSPRPIREEVLRQLPSWMRDASRNCESIPAEPARLAMLAICLSEQARLHIQLKQHSDALKKLAEARELFEQAGESEATADCLHLMAQAYEGLGDSEQALNALRHEEELRRRLAA
jgi:tetratricopeptide (TPR) repeat protein